jgi:hypothetical protein
MKMRSIVVLLGLLTCGRAALGAPLNHRLDARQVECVERQLARIQARMIAFGSPSFSYPNESGAAPLGYGRLALWHTSLRAPVFSGLVRIVDLGGNAGNDFLFGTQHFEEVDLAFELLFKRAVARLDPRQPRIPQAILVRRNAGTNLLVDHEGCYPRTFNDGDLTCPVVVSLDLSADADDPTHPETAIVINSAVRPAPGRTSPGAQPMPSATGRGPGILGDRLTETCGGTLTEFDQRVFEILARTVLPSECFWRPFNAQCTGGGEVSGYNMMIFRGADPHVFRVNIYTYTNAICDNDGTCPFGSGGPFALEFRIEWDERGRLTTGTAKVLPDCRDEDETGCSMAPALGAYVLPPIFPGHEIQEPAAFRGAPLLTDSIRDDHDILSARINWARILKDTALNPP